MGLKIWGNHCGPLHGTREQETTDKVDAACKKHDKNYGERGYFDLQSDLTLIRDQVSLQFTDLSLEQRLASAAITVAFVHLLPVSVTLTTARQLPELAEGVGNQLGRVAGGVKDGVEGAADALLDGINDAGGALASTGRGAWRAVTSIF